MTRALPLRPTELPADPGTYVLALEVEAPLALPVGALGVLRAPRGVLLYVGSAFGPGGLRARLGRHLAGRGARRWHVDHVRAVCPPLEAWWATDSTRREHAWAEALARLPEARIPLVRLGASDCRCAAHLVWLPALADLGPALEAGESGLHRAVRR